MKKKRLIISGSSLLVILFQLCLPVKSAIFTTIAINGPATNRVNLIFFSEGYTNNQMGKFLADVTNAANYFLTAQPYAEYSNYFNVFAIFTNSAHAGSTHLVPGGSPGTYNNGYTYFNSSYDDSSDYIITIPPNPVDGNSSHGQGKIDSLLQINFPGISTNNLLPVLLVNDVTTGGSDNYGRAAITSLGDVSHVLVHESGHTLGGLGDEYTSSYPGFPDVEEPNTTTNTNYLQIKWKAWISTNTPIPTPFLGIYENTVGLFAGAHYHATGWYRPFENCWMQSMDDSNGGFCPVCQEALVLAIYGKVRPIESQFPNTNSITVSSAQTITFSLNLMKPATHSLSIQWRTNKISVSGATNPVLKLLPSELGNGTQKIEADVSDVTDMVRTDTKNILYQTNLWTLNITLPVLNIDAVNWQTNGNFTFRVTGTSTDAIAIEISTNLIQWDIIESNYLNGGHLYYTNSKPTDQPKLFYRVKTPP